MAEEDVNEAIRACLGTSKKGQVVLQWLATFANDQYPLTVSGANGTDPVYAAFRDGGATMAREILERAGYRITYERKPDERRDDGNDGNDGGNGGNDGSDGDLLAEFTT